MPDFNDLQQFISHYDGAFHLFGSQASFVGVYAFSRFIPKLKERTRNIVAALFTIGAGVSVEAFQYVRSSRFSDAKSDLMYDATGLLTGAITVYLVKNRKHVKERMIYVGGKILKKHSNLL